MVLSPKTKYSYIPRRKNIVDILVTDFLPDSYQKYLFQNYKMNTIDVSMLYSDKIPTYLHGRPRTLIEHCMQM